VTLSTKLPRRTEGHSRQALVRRLEIPGDERSLAAFGPKPSTVGSPNSGEMRGER
jgi:hypothetical protein